MRNARLKFRQQERSHLMENLVYNDLGGSRKRWVDEDGVIYIGVIPFLLEDDHIIDRKY